MRERVLATGYEPATFEVEKSHITAFARAIGDDNPLWNDEAAARRSEVWRPDRPANLYPDDPSMR